MKKAITILAIFAIVIGSIFAANQTENHSIKLHTTIDEVVPVFHLVYKSASGTASSQVAIQTAEQSTNGSNAAFTANGAHDYTTESRSAVEVGDIAKGPITVNFDVTISNPAKIVRAYDLTLNATGFAVTHDGSPATTAITSKTLSGYAEHNGVNVTEKTANSIATATFTGKTCDDSTVLATYKVVYAQDRDADPTNAGATYTADVTLTITTTV